jgi:FkbM family methyltransferase
MSALRTILRIKAINHFARTVGLIFPPGPRKHFERKLPLVDAFTINLPNSEQIHFEPFGDICSKFLKFDGWNGYETPSVELFYALAQHAEVTFDVGAYLGYFGLLAAAAKPGAKAFLFEAVPQLAQMTARIIARNPHLQVEIIAAAVTECSGTIPLFLPEDPLSSDTSTNPGHRPDRQRVDVPAISLDEFVQQRQIDRVDLLKIDTETTEPAVLAGFAKTIVRCRPTFICEVVPTADMSALERFCAQYEYAHAWICPDGLKPQRTIVPDTSLKNLNYLFYPRNTSTPMVEEVRQRLISAS